MRNLQRGTICLLTLVLLAAGAASGEETAGQGLPKLIRGNEWFGRRLLQQVHSRAPERNVVISPLSLTVAFAAIRANSENERTREEIDGVFGWTDVPLSYPTRMLLAAFEMPEPRPCRRNTRSAEASIFCRAFEGTWITNTFLYRSTLKIKDPISHDFARLGAKFFGFKFVNTGYTRPTADDLRRARKATGAQPQLSGKYDAWITSGTHLQTTWWENTFSMSTPYHGEFRTAAGQSKLVEMLDSAVSKYLYAKTDAFEAVALQCESGYMIAVLPARGKDIHDLERELAGQPLLLDDALSRNVGKVSMPTFRIRFESDLQEPIKSLGIREVFRDLGNLVKIPNSYLGEITQKIDLQVTKDGIRADAETVTGLVYGGIMSVPQPFHMELNRPFLFLIRDETTNALLFIGAVMDPSQQQN